MSRWKLFLWVAAAFAIGAFYGASWQFSKTLPPIPVEHEVSIDERRGLSDGKFDATNGRGYQAGFYHPPVKSAEYWAGYCAGFDAVQGQGP